MDFWQWMAVLAMLFGLFFLICFVVLARWVMKLLKAVMDAF